MKRILLIFCLSAIWLPVHAATVYVNSETGDDAHTGASWAEAWQDVMVLQDSAHFTHGDTAYLHGEWTRVNLLPRFGGLNGTDRTAIIAGNGTDNTPTRGGATLMMGDTLKTWTLQSGSIYRCSRGTLTSGNIEGVAVDDTVIYRLDDAMTTPAAGHFGYDASYVYINMYDGGNPNSHYIMGWDKLGEAIIDWRSLTYFTGYGHLTLWGLTMKYGYRIVTMWENANIDSVYVLNCKLAFGGFHGDNSGLLTTQIVGLIDTTTFPWGWVIRGDSIGYSMEQQNQGYGQGIELYDYEYWTIDSNVFFGNFGHPDESGAAKCIQLKGGGLLGEGYGIPRKWGMIIRDNVFSPTYAANGICIYGNGQWESWIYGNTITGIAGAAIQFGQDGCIVNDATYMCSDNYVYNNTIYDCGGGSTSGTAEVGRWIGWGNQFKYNVVQINSGTYATVMPSARTADNGEEHVYIDSNIYYGGTGNFFYATSSSYTSLASWQAGTQWDDNSVIADPGFDDAANGDFSRPAASGEMNENYGGKTWTKYGAIQDDVEGETISTPGTPSGASTGDTGVTYQFTSTGATSDSGHTVEYRWDFGNQISGWGATTTADSSWTAANTYSVRIQARCATHATIISSWSAGHSIAISAPSGEPAVVSQRISGNMPISGKVIIK